MQASAEEQTRHPAGDIAGAIERAARGDMDALALIYNTYAASLMNVAYRLLMSRADAEDAVHDLFVGLPEALRRYKEQGAFEGWLKRIVARICLSRLRSPSQRGEELPDIVDQRRHDATDRIAVADALRELNPSLRAVVVLKEIEGYSHAEIAQMLGISKGASEVRLHRGMRALRELLSEDSR